MTGIEVRADQTSFNRVARALRRESDGRELRADLARNIHTALKPAVGEVRSALMSMASAGLPHVGEPLRQAVAARVRSDVRLGGPAAGARIRVGKTGMPRGFRNAPKRLNSRGWRHRVYGRDVWVTQIGQPGWFDDTLQHGQARYRVAVQKAMEDSAERVARGA